MHWIIFINFFDKLIEPETIVNQLFPNIWVFISHIIATIILLIIMRLFVYEPFKKMMRKRRKIIREVIDDAIQKQTQATKNETQSNLLLKASKIESQQLIDETKTQALLEREQIIMQAVDEAKMIEKQTHNDLIKERIKAEESIREEMIEVGFKIAEKVLQKEINKKQNQKIIDDFINELD